MKEVEIIYRIEKKEFVKHQLRKMLKPKLLILFLFLNLIISGKFILPLLGIDAYENSDVSNISVVMSLSLLLVVPILFLGFLWRHLSKMYNQTTAFQDDIVVAFNEEGYFGKSKISESSLNWEAIFKIEKQDKMLDIYFNKLAFASVPLRFVDDDQLIILKEILKEAHVKNNL